MTATQFEQLLETKGIHPDKVFKSKGNWVLRWGFFYKHGRTSDTFKNHIEKDLGVKVTESQEVWQVWPKDSYWEIKFPTTSLRE